MRRVRAGAHVFAQVHSRAAEQQELLGGEHAYFWPSAASEVLESICLSLGFTVTYSIDFALSSAKLVQRARSPDRIALLEQQAQ